MGRRGHWIRITSFLHLYFQTTNTTAVHWSVGGFQHIHKCHLNNNNKRNWRWSRGGNAEKQHTSPYTESNLFLSIFAALEPVVIFRYKNCFVYRAFRQIIIPVVCFLAVQIVCSISSIGLPAIISQKPLSLTNLFAIKELTKLQSFYMFFDIFWHFIKLIGIFCLNDSYANCNLWWQKL